MQLGHFPTMTTNWYDSAQINGEKKMRNVSKINKQNTEMGTRTHPAHFNFI